MNSMKNIPNYKKILFYSLILHRDKNKNLKYGITDMELILKVFRKIKIFGCRHPRKSQKFGLQIIKTLWIMLAKKE